MQAQSVLLADPDTLTRLGLKIIIDELPGFEVIGEAEDNTSLRSALDQLQPQIVILDYHSPESFGLESVSVVRSLLPKTKILVISSDHEKESIYKVLENGVHSYVTKSCGVEEIQDAIKATARGEKFFCTKVIDYLLEKSFAKEEDKDCAPSPLTPREIEVVQLIAKGLIAKEIAGQLNLSTHTVYTHRKNIMKKLNLNTSSELVLYAVSNGLLEKA